MQGACLITSGLLTRCSTILAARFVLTLKQALYNLTPLWLPIAKPIVSPKLLLYQAWSNIIMAQMQQDADQYFETWKPEHAVVDQAEKAEDVEVPQLLFK